MAEITIPFREDMAQGAQLCLKFCTSRNKKYGKVGDTFKITLCGETTIHQLVAVNQRTLKHVAYFLPDAEGLDGSVDFINVWNEIHPRKTYESDPEHIVWVHWFERVE